MQRNKSKWLNSFLVLVMCISLVFSPAVVEAAQISTTEDVHNMETNVEHFGGSDRFETAAKVAQEGWTSKSEFAILAGGNNDNLVDALAAAPLAKFKNAPILITESGSNSLNKYAEAELKRLEVKTIYVVSGEGVVKKAVLDKLSSMGITTIKLGGSNRWETAVNIARHMGDFNKVVVATGHKYADAASMASIAAAKGMPILLTDTNALPQGVQAYLGEIKDKLTQTYVVGGEGIISNSVMNALPNPKRLAGLNRYETNIKVITYFANDLKYSKTYVANGKDKSLVDALVGASLASLNDAPILLIGDSITDATRDFAERNLSSNIIALGGEKVVPSTMVSKLVTALNVTEDGTFLGSNEKSQPKRFNETIKITGDNVTLQNAILDYSVYVQGDKATLANLNVSGTVFLDPGEKGTTNLDNVKAAKIVVLSGAKESIHIKNSEAGTLIVSSSNEVRVESSGTTKVGNTVVNSYVVLDAAGGTLGTVEVISNSGQAPVVTLKGTFDQPIVVNGAATLKADANANIAKVEVTPETKEQKVTLEGTFNSVEVNKEANLNLGTTASVKDLITNAKANLVVESGAKVEKFDNKGNEGTISGDGSSSIPPSGQETTSSGNSGGNSGGSNDGGNNPSEEEQANALIAAAKALIPASINPDAETDTNLLTMLNAIEGMAATGVTLSISSSNNVHVNTNGSLVFGKSEVTGNVVISLAKTKGTTDTKTIAVVVPVISDAKAVAAAKEALIFDAIMGENLALDEITETLNLITDDSSFTDYGVTISWATDTSAISAETGKVSRPAYDEENVSGTLTAVLSKNEVSETKEFNVTVLKIDPLVFEDNNSLENAALIATDGVAQTHVINSVEDADWIKFEAEEGALYTIRTSNLKPEYYTDYAMDTEIYLYDANGNELDNDDDDDYGYGYWSRLDWVAPATGTYYVKVIELNEEVGQYDILVTKAAPHSIINVSADGYDFNYLYATDEEIEIYVVFSEDVTVTGTPRIKLATGASEERFATYTSGSGTSELTFVYTVQEGDNTKLLETFDTALDLNDGSIQTIAGEDVNLSLPLSSSLSSLSANMSIALNTVMMEYLYNSDNESIIVELNGSLIGDITGKEDAFTVTDFAGNNYEVTSVSYNDGDYEIDLSVSNLSKYAGKLYVSYKAEEGNIIDEFGNVLGDFKYEFIPDVDKTSPVFDEGYPEASGDTETSIQLEVKTNEVGKGYFVVLPKDAMAPSAAQVKAGTDGENNPLADNLKGEFDIVGDLFGSPQKYTTTINGLEAGTSYDIYIVCEDNNGNLQLTPGKVESSTITAEQAAALVEIEKLVAFIEEGSISSTDALAAYDQYKVVLEALALTDEEFQADMVFELGYAASLIIEAFVSRLEGYNIEGDMTEAELEDAYTHYAAALDLVDILAPGQDAEAEILEAINNAWAPISAIGRPAALPTNVSFVADTDEDFAQIAGQLTWTAVSEDTNVDGYLIYFVAGDGEKIGASIGKVIGKAETSFTVPENTEVPGSAASLGVYSYNKYGVSAAGGLYDYDYNGDDLQTASSGPALVNASVADGKININWTPADWASTQRQWIYILPTGTELNLGTQNSVEEIPNNTTSTWSGDIDEYNDSEGNAFQAGKYTAYIVAATASDENYYYWRWGSNGVDFEIATFEQPAELVNMTVTSAFANNEAIDGKYGKFGGNISLPISWTPVEGAGSYALAFYDPDATDITVGEFLHWMVVNIPNTVTEITEGLSVGEMPGDQLDGYNGPFPPSSAEGLPPEIPPYSHTYKLVVYALNDDSIEVQLDFGFPTMSKFNEAIQGKVIGKGELIGTFTVAPEVTNIVASDIGNNGNGSDLQVTFNAGADETKIAEYRVIVVKANNDLSVLEAEALEADRYQVVEKAGAELSVTLGDQAKDSDGEQIVEEVEYDMFILSVKNPDTTQISSLTKSQATVTLSQQ